MPIPHLVVHILQSWKLFCLFLQVRSRDVFVPLGLTALPRRKHNVPVWSLSRRRCRKCRKRNTGGDVSAVPRQGRHLKAFFLFSYLHRDTTKLCSKLVVMTSTARKTEEIYLEACAWTGSKLCSVRKSYWVILSKASSKSRIKNLSI